MVYKGPSKGCRKCRDRRVKCDQRQPTCLNCSTRGTTCPGYGDIFDKAHRNETVKIGKKHLRRSHNITLMSGRPTLNSGPVPMSPKENRLLGVESNALAFFFLRYGLCHDAEATCSFFGILYDMYIKSTISSPLNRATTALALQVAHLFCSHTGESSIGHNVYAEAVTQTQAALAAPAQSKSDELLMTTLVLEAYESANDTYGRRKHDTPKLSRIHLLGSIALLKHRGPLNFRDKLSWRLIAATRNRLLYHAWNSIDDLAEIETIRDLWNHGGRSKPKGPAVEADTLAFRLCRLRLLARLLGRTTSNGSAQGTKAHTPDAGVSDNQHMQDIAAHAIDLAGECVLWQNALSSSWRQISVPACTLATSIRAAGVYEHVDPSIYANLSIANSINRHRITELECFSFIGSYFASISSQEELQLRKRQMLPPSLSTRAQTLVDEICASVPFLTGDATAGQSSDPRVLVPSVTQTSSYGNGESCRFPRNTTEHAKQVVASGLYMMYKTLTAVLELVDSDGAIEGMGNVLRDGQVEWMMGQANRLRDVLHIAKEVG